MSDGDTIFFLSASKIDVPYERGIQAFARNTLHTSEAIVVVLPKKIYSGLSR